MFLNLLLSHNKKSPCNLIAETYKNNFLILFNIPKIKSKVNLR